MVALPVLQRKRRVLEGSSALVIERKIAIDRIGDRAILEQLLVLRRERRLAVRRVIDVAPGVDRAEQGAGFGVRQAERALRPLERGEQGERLGVENALG